MNLIAPTIHAIHVLAAGIWLGGLVFTITVISPSFRRMGWSDSERITVRSAVGQQYARVARINIAVLIIAAVADWNRIGFGALAAAELACILTIILLSEAHVRFFVPRLTLAAQTHLMDQRRALLRLSIGTSIINLVASVALVVLTTLSR